MLSKKFLSMFNMSSRYREVELKASITPDWVSSERDNMKTIITKSGRVLESILILTLFFSGKRNGKLCVFLSYYVAYNVNFTKIICTCMAHKLNIF